MAASFSFQVRDLTDLRSPVIGGHRARKAMAEALHEFPYLRCAPRRGSLVDTRERGGKGTVSEPPLPLLFAAGETCVCPDGPKPGDMVIA